MSSVRSLAIDGSPGTFPRVSPVKFPINCHKRVPFYETLIFIYFMRAFKKKRAGGLETETSTGMSKVLSLAVEALVPLRYKVVNGRLIQFPGLYCEPVPHVPLYVRPK